METNVVDIIIDRVDTICGAFIRFYADDNFCTILRLFFPVVLLADGFGDVGSQYCRSLHTTIARG